MTYICDNPKLSLLLYLDYYYTVLISFPFLFVPLMVQSQCYVTT